MNFGKAILKATRRGDHTHIWEYSQAPLQWLGSPGEPPVYYLRNPNGGLLGGDRHRIEIELGAGSALEIRTQGATRLHPGLIRQQVKVKLAPTSQLIWIPHPTIPGAGADFRQQVQIELDPTARLAYAEIWTAGRLAMDERWQFEHLANCLQVWVTAGIPSSPEGRKLWLQEHIDLHFPHRQVSAASVLGSHLCWGSLYLLGDWPEPTWPTVHISGTESPYWLVKSPDPICKGWILRQVGPQAEAIWRHFGQVALQLAQAKGGSPQGW